MVVVVVVVAYNYYSFVLFKGNERRIPKVISVLGSQPTGDRSCKPGSYMAAIAFRQAHLPKRRASPPFGRYLVILLDGRCTWV